MTRGFDYLNNPAGLTLVGLGMFLVVGIIAVGGVLLRQAAIKDKEKREALKKEWESKE